MGTALIDSSRLCSQNALCYAQSFYGSLSLLSLAHTHTLAGLSPQGFGISCCLTFRYKPPAPTAPSSPRNAFAVTLPAFAFSKTGIARFCVSMEPGPTVLAWCWGNTSRLQIFVPLE